MKYAKGDIVYLAYGTAQYKIVDVIGKMYFLESVHNDPRVGVLHTHQTDQENTINPRTIYERLDELEANSVDS